MKYDKELYLDSGFYGGDFGDDITNHKEKIVKCRKPHKCNGGCDGEIKAGDYALLETGFMDGELVSSYTCLPCIEEWLEESGQVDTEDLQDKNKYEQPEPQEEIKGCSGECDLCPGADDCEQCGSV